MNFMFFNYNNVLMFTGIPFFGLDWENSKVWRTGPDRQEQAMTLKKDINRKWRSLKIICEIEEGIKSRQEFWKMPLHINYDKLKWNHNLM